MSRSSFGSRIGSVVLILATMLLPRIASAHCDGMDGPVVKAAQEALATRNVNLTLVWVRESEEAEVRSAFARTLAVRELGTQARELADLFFFETLVRLHRLGEGAPYTGLKPAGRDLGPAIPLADSALVTGGIDTLVTLLTGEMRQGILDSYRRAANARRHARESVEAGREFVHAYVAFIHFVERAHELLVEPAAGHFPEHHPER